MNPKVKKIAISFIIMILIKFIFSSTIFFRLGVQNPHVGLLFVFGLLFGPYGALGAVLANIILDLTGGFTIQDTIFSAIFSFGVSYLAYKLWYSGFISDKITKPKLDNINHLILFLLSILVCGLIYSATHGNYIGITIGRTTDEYIYVSYLLNFVNFAVIFGIVNLWIFNKTSLIETPKISKKPANKKLYRILFYLLMTATIFSTIALLMNFDKNFMALEILIIGILLFAYITKPNKFKIQPNDKNTIIENILQNFIILTLIIAIIGVVISIFSYDYIIEQYELNLYLYLMPSLIVTDIIIILFIVPGIFILKYIERKVLNPISSFSEIERFIKENEKIESEGLVEIYSKYLNEQNEIGTLARSYTELIKHNNNYIENIHEIESEKERINAELDIATRIQAASLPTEPLENDDFIVNGYSKPAKEVGGDFFDYYMIDEDNLAIVIGDVSGKGIPAALVAMISQVMIKRIFDTNKDPSKVLHILNNQMCENNSESMFLTLWLGIYNKTTKKLQFSNAGHNPPLIKENDKFKYLPVSSGIVLGILEDFEYELEESDLTDELILYTDGITDASNKNNEMYGQDRVLNFYNDTKSDEEPISILLNDINEFTKDAKQYDDMTLLYLKVK